MGKQPVWSEVWTLLTGNTERMFGFLNLLEERPRGDMVAQYKHITTLNIRDRRAV